MLRTKSTSSASSTTSLFYATATSRSDSQDVRVALRCGYGSTGSSTSSRALRSRSSCKTGRNLPLNAIKEECRKIVTSDLQPDPCQTRDSSSAPGASPAANETMGNKRPLAPICAPPRPDELRRGGLKEQTPRTARAVLITPFDGDAQKLPTYMADVSPPQSRWTRGMRNWPRMLSLFSFL